MRKRITIETDDKFLADNVIFVLNDIINQGWTEGHRDDDDDNPLTWTMVDIEEE